MDTKRVVGVLGTLVALGALLVAACAPAPEPTAAPPAPTTAVAPTATTAAPVEPVATTEAPVATIAVATGKEKAALQPVPVLTAPLPNPKAKHGGILRILSSSYPPDWTHWETTNGATSCCTTPLHDNLLEYNAWEGVEKRDSLLPNLAHNWWVSADGQTWTFELVQGAKFHDGTEMTCADAQWMVDTIRLGRDSKGSEMRASPRGKYLTRVTQVRCVDDYTLEITTDGPLPSLPGTIAVGNFGLYPKAVFEGNMPLMISQPGPGMGPFILTEQIAGERLSYKRNPNYWRQPYPYLDGINNTNVGSATAVYAAFRVGRGELGQIPSGNLKTEIEKGYFRFQTSSRHGGYFTDINFKRQPWGDVRVRMALRCAIDNPKYVKVAVDGFHRPDMGIWPSDSPWVLPPERQAAIHPCLDPKTSMEKRRELSKALLAQVGFGPDNPLTGDMMIRGSAFVFEPWLDDLQQVNIVPKARILQVAQAYSAAYAGEFDFHPSGFITPRHDPDTWLYEHYYSTSDRNYGKYTNAEVDALIDLQSRTLDLQERRRLNYQIQEILLRETGKLINLHYDSPSGSAPWLIDYTVTDPSIAGTYNKYTRTWIDQNLKKTLGG